MQSLAPLFIVKIKNSQLQTVHNLMPNTSGKMQSCIITWYWIQKQCTRSDQPHGNCIQEAQGKCQN